MTTIAQQLAQRYVRLDYRRTPEANRHSMRRLLLDYIGVGIAGSQTESGVVGCEFAVVQGGKPEVTLIGPPGLPSETAGDAGQVIGILSRVSGQAAGCGAAGTLRVRVGRGLEQALWSGIGEADCLRQAVGAQAWPALERPMELEWPIQP